jgi:predicted NAD/FAD-dependent oxidoreductase
MRDAHPAKRIAIVGGGISGLALAKFLRDVDSDRRRFELHLFDTGERACGGRASSKALSGVDVDHGLQYFTLSSDVARESFARSLVDAGALTSWSDDVVGILDAASGRFTAFSDGAERFVGVDGFRGMSEELVKHCDVVHRPQWVGAMHPVRRDDDGNVVEWALASNESDRAKQLGTYDFVVVAHNGKCAHRLASTAKDEDGRSACEKVKSSLRCGFGVKPRDELSRENKLVLSSVWSVMVVFDGVHDFGDGFEGAHVVDGGPLSWVSNISAKRGAVSQEGAKETRVVLQSTAEYARENKVPQEAVPKPKSKEVMETLVGALEKSLKLEPNTMLSKVTMYKTQLWGAANPLNVCNVPCVLDLRTSTAAIGDWCTSGPACVESAVLSANALAQALDDYFPDATPGAATKALNAARPRWTLPNGATSAQGGFPGTSVPEMREASPVPERRRGGGRGRGPRGRGGGRGGRGRGRGAHESTARLVRMAL